MRTTLGAILMECIREESVTLVAERVGVDRKTIWRIVNAGTPVSRLTAKAIADYLSTPGVTWRTVVLWSQDGESSP